jgi:RimJ/RimL family protein N-acetyltransferase
VSGLPAPYRIETGRLVLRCYEPDDAPLLKEAVDASIEHLLPWMPWARYEPQSLDQKIELLRGMRSRFDSDEDYVYGVFDADEERLLGGSGLHPRAGHGAREIGYWVRADAVGQGIATEVTAVLTRVGIELLGLRRVDVQVDPDNERSLRIPRRLGFAEDGVLRRRLEPKEDGGDWRDSVVFSMLDGELAGSPCTAYGYEAYDAIGRVLGC